MDVTEKSAGRAVQAAVVVNPAKIDDLDGFRASVDGALTGAGWPAPRWYETTPKEPGRTQTAAAVDAGAEIVFVAGGDGTILSAVSALVGTDTAMAVLPAGTGNLLAANLGLSTDLLAGLEVALEGGLRRLDVGEVDGQYFTVMAGMGFDARMLDATSDTAKARIGWPAYLLGALRHLTDRRMKVTVRVDGGEPIRRRAQTVLVANVGRMQGGVRLLTEAKPDDGLLDVAILTPRTLRHWLALGWAVLRRKERVPSMDVFRGARVEVASDRVQPRQLDGDLVEAGRLLNVQVLSKALWLCVPQPAGHPDLAQDADAAAERGHRLVAPNV